MKNRQFIFLLFTVLLGAALRLDLLIANNFVIDSDEAIVGLMAKHINEGRGIPVFYYGQHYMGSLEAICVSFVFRLFGISSLALKIVPFAFSLLMILAVYDLTLHAINKRAASIAAFMCAVSPSALMIWSSMARGGFIELIFIGALSFCLLARWLKLEQGGSALIALQGLILGIGWWVNNQILYFMIPTAAAVTGKILYSARPYYVSKVRQLFASAFTGLFFWLIGSLPYWIYNMQHDWASLGMFNPAGENKIAKHFQGFYEQALPIILGGSRFWQAQDIYPGSLRISLVLYGIVFVLLIAFRFKTIFKALRGNFGSSSMPEVLMMFLLCCGAIFVVSSFGWLSQAPRYLLPMYVGIFPLTALVLDRILDSSRFVGSFAMLLILSLNLASSYFGGRSIPGEPVVFKGDRVSKDHTELISWLEKNNVHWIRANYWIGYRLAFETLENTRFLVVHEPSQTRLPEWEKEAEKQNDEIFPVLTVPAQAKYIRRALEILHVEYQEEIISGYHLFYNLKPVRVELRKIDPSEFEISSNYKNDSIKNAIDNDVLSRWGSGEAQKPDMQIRVDFKKPVNLAGITYKLGGFTSDYPRAFRVEFIHPDGTSHLYFAENGWESLRHFVECEAKLELHFESELIKSVIFKQTGKDAIFDWSVAELEFFAEINDPADE